MTQYVVDTNVFLDDLGKLDRLDNIVVLSHVIRELENHKRNKNDELAFQARKATRYIEENMGKFQIDLNDYSGDIGGDYDADYVDNKIIDCCRRNAFGLITRDLLLKIKARGFGIPVYELGEQDNGLYTGFKEVVLEDSAMADFYHNHIDNPFSLIINQYLIIKNKDGEVVDTFRWDGEEHKKLHLPPKKVIKPQNHLQACAVDLLYNLDIPIKIIAGTYGSGKTLLSVKAGLDFLLAKDWFAKIMVVRNPIGTGESIGWLKGDKKEKTDGFFQPIIQHLDGGEQQAFYLEQTGRLLREIPYYMKGLSLENTYVLVDEAEDLDKKQIKLLGTRIGQGSCIVFSGDYGQAEDKYIHNNGLVAAIEKLKGNPMVGIVVLQDDVRSQASKLFGSI